MSALANMHKAINLSQGFPGFDVPQHLKDRVAHYLQAGFNQYAPMQGVRGLRRDKLQLIGNAQLRSAMIQKPRL